jgi:hypothetical protein
MASAEPLLPTAGLLAEFSTPEAMVAAARELVAAGLERMEAYTPYPVPAVESVLCLGRSPVARQAFIAGLTGAVFAYALQYYLMAVDYPVLVGGMPPHSGPAFIPITFETTVLFAGVTSFISVFVLSGLPRLWHPVFDVPAFLSASIDGFWLEIDPSDRRFDEGRCTTVLTRCGATRIIRPGVVT